MLSPIDINIDILKLLEQSLRFFRKDLVYLMYDSAVRGDSDKKKDLDLLIIMKNLLDTRFKKSVFFTKFVKALILVISKLFDIGYQVDFLTVKIHKKPKRSLLQQKASPFRAERRSDKGL